jgi:hypothetical protein
VERELAEALLSIDGLLEMGDGWVRRMRGHLPRREPWLRSAMQLFQGGRERRGKPSDRSLVKRMRYWNYIIGPWLGYSPLVHAYYSYVYAYYCYLVC